MKYHQIKLKDTKDIPLNFDTDLLDFIICLVLYFHKNIGKMFQFPVKDYCCLELLSNS